MEHVTQLQQISVSYERHYPKEAIRSSTTVVRVCRQAFANTLANIFLKEYAFIILLNSANEVIGYFRLSDGGLSATIVDVRLAFSIALKCLATGMILCHNHPSSNLRPSRRNILRDKAIANDNNKRACVFIQSLRGQNKSFRAIATILNKNGYKTAKNKLFQAATVKRLYDKAELYIC